MRGMVMGSDNRGSWENYRMADEHMLIRDRGARAGWENYCMMDEHMLITESDA
jgi:hypothetical protein